MLTQEELVRRFKPLVKQAGHDSAKFVRLALPVMEEHLGDETFSGAYFDVWNDALVIAINEVMRERSLH